MNVDDRPEDENPHLDRPLRSFGRIKARPIKPRQAALMETLLPEIAVPDPKAGPLDPKTMMPEATEVWLEIGFGAGEPPRAAPPGRPRGDLNLLVPARTLARRRRTAPHTR